MLQQVEYEPTKFSQWSFRLIIKNQLISTTTTRKQLIMTKRARLLLFVSYFYLLATLSVSTYLSFFSSLESWIFGIIIWIILAPLLLALFLYFLTFVAFKFVVEPEQSRLTIEAEKIFAAHKGVKIAVLGSYGKTTMKEMLNTVLSEGMNVATTPGNLNVSVSHARFAKKLSGVEEVLIVEFGEGKPGDITRMAHMLHPDYAIITGLAPNHLDFYPGIESIAEDLLDIYKFVSPENVFASGESAMLEEYLPSTSQLFTAESTLDWHVNDIRNSIDGVSFLLENSNNKINIRSGLLGSHQVAPLSCVAVVANKLGVTNKEIEKGMSKTVPHEHRMYPRFVHGAWLIDDTYNGNLEGLKAGLKLLSELDGRRKWYVTPGLVDQGSETYRVHQELGISIAETNPDIVVLMDNSVCPIIKKTLLEHGYAGELRVEANPLEFYTQLEHVVAAGDIVLMQNDWTDNYN